MIRLANYKENFKNYIAGKKYDYDVLKVVVSTQTSYFQFQSTKRLIRLLPTTTSSEDMELLCHYQQVQVLSTS